MFDVSPEEFFCTIVYTFTRFRSARAKERSDLFYLIMGLNHLREWIAPGYTHTKPAKTQAEAFYNDVYACPEWKILNALCNGAKHAGEDVATHVKYDLPISEWPSISGVVRFSKGPPSAFYCGSRNIEEVFDVVITFYQAKWFANEAVDLLLATRPS
jgi:hypothetical protein